MENLPLKLTYRPLTRRLYKITFWCTVFSEVVLIRYRALEIFSVSWPQGLLTFLLASSVPLTVLLRLFLVVRPRLFSLYEVCDDHFIHTFKKKRSEVHYSQITKIDFSHLSPRFLGGYKITLKSGARWVFLSALKNNEVLLEKIAAFRPELLTSNQWKKYHLMSRFVEISWERMREKCRRWPKLMGKYFGFGLLLSYVALLQGWNVNPNQSVLENILWYDLKMTCVLWPLAFLFNHFEEIWIQNHMTKNSDKESFVDLKRDLGFEKRVRWVINSSFYLITLTLFFVLH